MTIPAGQREDRPVISPESLPDVELREPYRPRSVTFLELWQPNGWIVKLYGLAYQHDAPDPSIIEAAKQAAAEALPQPPRNDERYGIGFVIIHQGQDACWLLLDWWGYESVLHHRLLMAPLGLTAPFDAPPPNVAACVWELPILLFERNAWVASVMSDTPGGGIDAYLAERLVGAV